MESCPTADVLHRFAFGEVDSDQIDAIVSHLKLCEDCRETLWQVDSSNDPFIQLLRNPPPAEPFTDEVECKREVEHLANADLGWLSDEASHPTRTEEGEEKGTLPQLTPQMIYAMVGVGVLLTIAAIAFWFMRG